MTYESVRQIRVQLLVDTGTWLQLFVYCEVETTLNAITPTHLR